jgi:hypothetical protein
MNNLTLKVKLYLEILLETNEIKTSEKILLDEIVTVNKLEKEIRQSVKETQKIINSILANIKNGNNDKNNYSLDLEYAAKDIPYINYISSREDLQNNIKEFILAHGSEEHFIELADKAFAEIFSHKK